MSSMRVLQSSNGNGSWRLPPALLLQVLDGNLTLVRTFYLTATAWLNEQAGRLSALALKQATLLGPQDV